MKYDNLLGKPYEDGGGDGKESFDCGSLVRLITGINVNIIPSLPEDKTLEVAKVIKQNKKYFTELSSPKEGCIVSMGKLLQPHHVGVWVEGRILHCVQGVGVVYSDLMQCKANGFKNINYWKYNENS